MDFPHSDAIEQILAALRQRGDLKRTANGWDARCPVHDDDVPSLGIAVGKDGAVLLKCRSQGCSAEAICRALGLTLRDLFPSRNGRQSRTIVATYDYLDCDGKLLYQVVRFVPKDFRQRRPDGRGGWAWTLGDVQRVLYRLPQVIEAVREGLTVYVVEGEKDVHALATLGFVATTNAMGAGKWRSEYNATLRGADVVILPDNDKPGRDHAQQVARALAPEAGSVKVVALPGLLAKGDVSDWIASGGTREELLRLVGAASVWTPVAEKLHEDEPDKPAFAPVPLRQLLADYPSLRPPVIHGLLRQGETANVISASKAGKSWLRLGLVLPFVLGRPRLDTFNTEPGRALIIDNELHPESISHRIRTVAAALNIDLVDVEDKVEVQPLRGRLLDIDALAGYFASLKRGKFSLVVVDALYRLLPERVDENSNAGMASVYNAIDSYAGKLGAAFVLVHHMSKGNQSAKGITDVGSGAGAQSRAVDSHLVLRPHEKDDAVVLEAAVRSWPPINPLCLRWDFPLWRLDSDLDPAALKGASKAKGQTDQTAERVRLEANARTLLHAMCVNDPDNEGVTRNTAMASAGFTWRTCGPVITQLIESGSLTEMDGFVEVGCGGKRRAKLLKRTMHTPREKAP